MKKLLTLVLCIVMFACTKDNSDDLKLTVQVSEISSTSAILQGFVDGDDIVISQWFEYRAENWPLGKTIPVDESFRKELTMLQPGTTYIVTAHASTKSEIKFSNEIKFITLN